MTNAKDWITAQPPLLSEQTETPVEETGNVERVAKANIALGIADSIRSQLYDLGPMEAFDAAAIIIADLEAKGYVIVPSEPTEGMVLAGREPVFFRELRFYRPEGAPIPDWQKWPDGSTIEETTKGATAYQVYRAMLAARGE